MKAPCLLFLSLLLAASGNAQRFLTEVFPSVSKTAGVVYGHNYSVLNGGHVPVNLVCDVYEPAGAPDTLAARPLVIYLHGGSFLPAYLNGVLEGGRNDSGVVAVCRQLARRGFVVANIDYRLGWNPLGSNVDIRRGTLLQAIYRGVQDLRAAIRYFRKDAAAGNGYRIDTNQIIAGGHSAAGATIAFHSAALISPAQLGIPQFISGITDTALGFETARPFVNPLLLGDLDGSGGDPAWNDTGNSPGYGSGANFVFGMEPMMADSSWITPGRPPMVAFHRRFLYTGTFPGPSVGIPFVYGYLQTYVGPLPQVLMAAAGSGALIPTANRQGNNDCFRPNNFSDPYTVKAMALSGGVEGLYPFYNDTATLQWYDSAASVSACQAAGLTLSQCNSMYALQQPPGVDYRQRALSYIDTFLSYLAPRIVKCFGLGTLGVTQYEGAIPDIRLYPNPAHEAITIETAGGDPIRSVEIRDMSGKVVMRATVRGELRVHLRMPELAPGIYAVTVYASRGIRTRKLTVL